MSKKKELLSCNCPDDLCANTDDCPILDKEPKTAEQINREAGVTTGIAKIEYQRHDITLPDCQKCKVEIRRDTLEEIAAEIRGVVNLWCLCNAGEITFQDFFIKVGDFKKGTIGYYTKHGWQTSCKTRNKINKKFGGNNSREVNDV